MDEPARRVNGRASPLTDAEQRLADFVREGKLDAEIAVRMGVPIGDVKERVAAILRKLGLRTRAELAAWAPTPVNPAATDMQGNGEERPARRHSRRALLLAGAAGTAILAGGGAGAAFWASRRGGGAETRAPGSTPTPDFIHPNPTVAPQKRGLEWVAPAPGAFEQRVFEPWETIIGPHGIYFMDPSGGEVVGHSLTKALATAADGSEGFVSYSAPGDGRFVLARTDRREYLLDRTTGAAHGWARGGLGLAAAGPSTLIFEDRAGPADDPNAGGTGRFTCTTPDMVQVSAFELDAAGKGRRPVAVSPDGAAAVFATGNRSWGDYTSLDFILVAGGFPLASSPLPGTQLLPGTPLSNNSSSPGLYLERAPGGVFASLVYAPAWDAKSAAYERTPWRTVLRRYAWDGRLLAERAYQGSHADVSPRGGAFVSIQDYLRYVPATSEGGGDTWPAVVVFDSYMDEPLFRVRSALITYGDSLKGSRWLADGSGLVFATGTGEPGQPWRSATFAIARLDGTVLPLDISESFWGGPVPSPRFEWVFALGHDSVYDNKRVIRANTSEQWFEHVGPWTGTGDELVFALPHGGHGFGLPGVLLPPKVEFPPFDDELAFRVARTGDCVNVREEPSMESGVVACLPDGARLELGESPDTSRTADRRSIEADPDRIWVYVRTPDGSLAGWVAKEFLDWA